MHVHIPTARLTFAFLLCALVILLAAPGAATAAKAKPHPAKRFPTCSMVDIGHEVRPSTLNAACAGRFHGNFTGLTWTGWNAPTATGTGTMTLPRCYDDVDEDEDSCPIEETFESPVTITLTGTRSCFTHLGPRRFYTTAHAAATISDEFASEAWPAGPYVEDWTIENCAPPLYVASASARSVRFGPYESGDGSEADGSALEAIFGTPTRTRFASWNCTRTWRVHGLTVVTDHTNATTGDPSQDTPQHLCANGTFAEAILTGRRWHTRTGIRPGSRARAARRVAAGPCTFALCQRRSGYVLVTQRRSCGSGAFQTAAIIAQVARGRVTNLILRNTLGC